MIYHQGAEKRVWHTKKAGRCPIRVFKLDPNSGERSLLADDFLPNGLCFSPDETKLYVNDTACSSISRCFDVDREGTPAQWTTVLPTELSHRTSQQAKLMV